ncbi:sensor histidine kinase [Fundidesulfovibrio putealis]|uniref:sensor histidine kinase n=1 Tax=Fundidesulfovibrio putealis TaxID=270496 RepID=UPI00040638F8|nr:HAMP domain-containing sensor histidine kinase [Fundidesulfovibrio putealis]
MEKTPRQGRYRDGSFGLLKFVSWGTLVLTLLASLFMSIFLANLARQVLLEKQHEFARLWAETLNHNISRRFALPAVLQFGELNLANPEQYRRLESVVRSVLEDFPVQDLRIFTPDGVVGFALDKSLVGEQGLGGEAVALAVDESKLTYEIIYQTGALGAMFSAEIAPRSVVMRTMAPLRFKATIAAGPDGPSDPSDPDAQSGQTPADPDSAAPEASASPEGAAPGEGAGAKPGAKPGENQSGPGRGVKMVSVNEVIGALEFTQDITSDYQKLITFQRVIILSALGTALLIFFVLRMLIHRADRINAQRMREREEYEREAVQNEKLVSMGRMVAGIAHEIRNPLGIIRSSAELLVSRLKDKDPLTAKIMAAIHEEAVRLSKTVGDFLDYARPRTMKLDPLDLGLLMDQALTFLEQKCREQRVEVVRDYPTGVMVAGDKDMLYRALYNILVNALEAMSVQKSQQGEDVAGQIVVRMAVEKSGIRLRIMDTGPGIPPDIRDKLLDPFFTTKDSGTGLGLAITANILRSHDAVIELGDNPEGGARVDILFPKP